jgi:hypothetical protein
MKNVHEKVAATDWQRVTEEINEKGYAIVSQFLPVQSCEELIGKYDDYNLYRKTIMMERHQFGSGEYKYFKYPLPELIQTARRAIYPKLAPVANAWMKMLNIVCAYSYSPTYLLRLCFILFYKIREPLLSFRILCVYNGLFLN